MRPVAPPTHSRNTNKARPQPLPRTGIPLLRPAEDLRRSSMAIHNISIKARRRPLHRLRNHILLLTLITLERPHPHTANLHMWYGNPLTQAVATPIPLMDIHSIILSPLPLLGLRPRSMHVRLDIRSNNSNSNSLLPVRMHPCIAQPLARQ